MKLTRAQAHRLIELFGYTGAHELLVERLTTAELFVFDAPRRDRLELDPDLSGEPVSWVAQDQIDRLIYAPKGRGGRAPRAPSPGRWAWSTGPRS